jgi:hypothetical protein
MQRFTRVKERASQAWGNVRETGSRLKDKLGEIKDISMVIASNPEVQKDLRNFMQEKVSGARERFRNKNRAVKERAISDRDFLMSKFREGNRKLWTGANETLVKPSTEKASKIARGLKSGGEKVNNFFQHQSEKMRDGIRARGAEAGAGWNRILAKSGEIKSGFLVAMGEKHLESATNTWDRAQQHRVRATELRTAASTIKGGNAVQGATA